MPQGRTRGEQKRHPPSSDPRRRPLTRNFARRARKFRPCNLDSRESDKSDAAVTGGCSLRPGSLKTVGERRTPPVNPQSPNSRQGRKARSSFRQGRVGMDKNIVGIDVSKDRLDVEVRPSRETFFVGRNAIGLEKLVTRVRELSPHLIALEATGGF